MSNKSLLLSFAGLVAAVVVVTGVASALHSDDETSEDSVAAENDDAKCAAEAAGCEEPTGGVDPDGGTDGGASGTCLEGTVDCIDTPLTPPDGSEPVSGGSGDALGMCIAGAVECVDTIVEPGGDEPASSDGEEPVLNDGAESRATELALNDLSGRLGVNVEAIAVESVASITWGNACLGIESAGVFCAEVITPGFIVALVHADVTYVYHTDEGNTALLAE